MTDSGNPMSFHYCQELNEPFFKSIMLKAMYIYDMRSRVYKSIRIPYADNSGLACCVDSSIDYCNFMHDLS